MKTGKKSLQWQFEVDHGGTVRFSEDYSDPDIWREKGEYSPDGNQWFQFFEMNLTKI